MFVVWSSCSTAWSAEPALETLGPGPAPLRAAIAAESNDQPTRATAPPKKHPPSKNSVRKKIDHGFTAEREAAALTFVRQYHPELAKLLAVLKTKEKEEYYRAVRDLFRTSERLALYREKLPERYDLELKAWQIKSRIQLLATRLKLAPDDTKLAEQLKSALMEQVDIRLEILRQDREQMAARLKRLDEQIEKLRLQRDLDVARQLETLLRSTQKKTPPKHGARETGDDGAKRVTKETRTPAE